jgi:hypothetical protein
VGEGGGEQDEKKPLKLTVGVAELLPDTWLIRYTLKDMQDDTVMDVAEETFSGNVEKLKLYLKEKLGDNLSMDELDTARYHNAKVPTSKGELN